MTKARIEKNETILGHLERLEGIRKGMMTAQIGMSSPSAYDVNEIVEAMKRLAKEIVTDALVEAF